MDAKQRKKVYVGLAEKLCNRMGSDSFFVCHHLDWHSKNGTRTDFPEFFLFEPTPEEKDELGLFGTAWFTESTGFFTTQTPKTIEGNTHRLMALLLCAEMCETETNHKKIKK